jgi:Protein of unknown function (DUF2934)
MRSVVVASHASGSATNMPAVGDTCHNGRMVSANDIRLCAYRKWENAGMPTGDGLQFWLEAEQELAHAR